MGARLGRPSSARTRLSAFTRSARRRLKPTPFKREIKRLQTEQDFFNCEALYVSFFYTIDRRLRQFRYVR